MLTYALAACPSEPAPPRLPQSNRYLWCLACPINPVPSSSRNEVRMGANTIHLRSSWAIRHPYFLIVGLSHYFLCCHAIISLSPKPAVYENMNLSNCLFRGSCRLIYPKLFEHCFGRGRYPTQKTLCRYVTTETIKKCAASTDTAIASKWEFAATNNIAKSDDGESKTSNFIRNMLVALHS